MTARADDGDPIARALGELRWGMSKARVQKLLAASRELPQRDASSVLGELLPSRADTFLFARDAHSRLVCVFRAGKLHKLYMLFEPFAFPEGNFRAFSASLQRRFGPAEAHSAELAAGGGVFRHWVEWRDHTTRVRAVDETNHRGFYCLVFEPIR